jgi:hypothetical protein
VEGEGGPAFWIGNFRYSAISGHSFKCIVSTFYLLFARTGVEPFFSLFVFGGTEIPIVYTLLCAPQRTVYKEIPSQMAAHPRTGSPL